MADSSFLRAIVAPILPHSSQPTPPTTDAASPEATAGASATNPAAAQAATAAQHGPAVRALCALLYRLMLLPGQRQRVLIGLAVRAELAQRLWFSYLKEAHAARGACLALRPCCALPPAPGAAGLPSARMPAGS